MALGKKKISELDLVSPENLVDIIIPVVDLFDSTTKRLNFSQIFNFFGGIAYKGEINCSTNPNYPAADYGHLYTISAGGKIGGNSGREVITGAIIICKINSSPDGSQDLVGDNWSIPQGSLLTNTEIINPEINSIGTTKLIDSYDGILVTLTKSGNSQILQPPSILKSGNKTYTVINNNLSGLNTIIVNGITLNAGNSQTWIWNRDIWSEIDLGITSLPVPITQGGTGRQSLNKHSILLGSGINSIEQIPEGKTGEILCGQTGEDPIWVPYEIFNKNNASSIEIFSSYTILDNDTYSTIFVSGNTTIKLPVASIKRSIRFKK